jgi:membrane protease subunit HflK
MPFPIESVDTPKVTQVHRVEVGFRSLAKGGGQTQVRAVPEEAYTLTGDENIVNVQFSVQYKIRDAVEYLFRVTNQAAVVQSAAEAAMREVIGTSEIDSALTDGKLKIQEDATRLLQNILDRYEVGVQIIAVQLQDVHPPQDVIEAFKDVASAREDKSRIINEAEAYRNEILPRARGQAAEMINQSQAYRATRIRAAEGEAGRFLAVLAEYQKAKDVTRKRLYYETLEEILSSAELEKIVLPPGAADRTLPLLPLDVLGRRPARPAQSGGGN